MQPKPWQLIAACGILVYGLACLLQYPAQQRRAVAVPRLTCDQLLRDGPGQDGYATLTDVRFCAGGFAFWRDAQSPGDVDVFIPVYAANAPHEPRPDQLRLLLEVQDSVDWQRLRQTDVVELTCLVGAADRIPGWAQTDLAGKYRGLRFADLKVLTVGLHEPTAAKAKRLLWHGTLAIVGGSALLAWLWWKRRSLAADSTPG